MTLEELNKALVAADPAAVLVPAWLLRRIIQQACKLPSQFLKIPHQKSFVIDRQLLFRYVEHEDLHLDADRLLPLTVILLAQPSTESLHRAPAGETLQKYWQRLFHAKVHQVLERQLRAGDLSLADVHARVEEIGQIEFDEIRAVLDQEHYLFPSADEAEVYFEFAAVYLELRHFAPNLRAIYFPAIRDMTKIDQVLGRDLDADAVFQATRPTGAPDPVERIDPSSDEPSDYYWRLVRGAERAARAGNTVRAAILRTQAAGVAPGALTLSTRTEALADLQHLAARLQAALRLTDMEAQEWLRNLSALLDKAHHGRWTVEASLLYDLQKVCIDHEHEIYALDLVEWGLSGGKRPIKRPLPGQRFVRIIKHLRNAFHRLPMIRVPDSNRQHLVRLMQAALQQNELRLQARFRPILMDAFHDVGLQPSNAPEHIAFHKTIEELLDRITNYGFLTFSDLRDAISRNNLKLPDMTDPQEFVRGDPLQRLDRRLAASLDGVYRPSEIYLRWLERFTSLSFGTRLGRLFTRYVALPFGSALLLLEAVQLMLGEYYRKLEGPEVPAFGPLSLLLAALFSSEPPTTAQVITGTLAFVSLGSLLFGLIYVQAVRRAFKDAVLTVYRHGYRILVELPSQYLPLPALRMIWKSWPFQLFYWFLFKPTIVCLLLWWWLPDAFATPLSAGSIFVLVSLFMNSRIGMGVNEGLTEGIYLLSDWFRSGLLLSTFHFIVRLFKRITDAVEYVLYTVDEWLRFRSGDTRPSMVVRAVLGVLWYPVSYLARLYVVVLIEPGINPIKLPVSIMAAKLILPFTSILMGFIADPLTPLVGPVIARIIALINVWLLPDAFGFLFWETKENWSLYRANRPATLQPVGVGPHGETMQQLLHPGFHTGRLPKLYARLRRAEVTAYQTGSWRIARSYRQALVEIEQSLRLFLERDLLMLLYRSPSWNDRPLTVGTIALASNRISIELQHVRWVRTPLWLAFEEQAGWLVASVTHIGWMRELEPQPLRALVTALLGLYKLAGVSLVREQIRAALPPEVATYEITESGLVCELDGPNETKLIYALRAPQEQLAAHDAHGAVSDLLPVLDARCLILGRINLTWEQWVDSWQADTDGRDGSQLMRDLFQDLLKRRVQNTIEASEV